MHVGDGTSTLTVMTYNVAVGVSTITVDSGAGIITGDTIAAAGLPNSGLTTVTAYNTSTNVITYTGVSTAGISTGGQITVTHAFDTNTDRGLSFTYNLIPLFECIDTFCFAENTSDCLRELKIIWSEFITIWLPP